MLSREKEMELSRKLGYEFHDSNLLYHALTHSSYINENNLPYEKNNERLEFLGDAILDAIISEYLYRKYVGSEEGMLTKERAAIVCESSLAFCASNLNLGAYLILGRGEENNGGRTRVSISADAVEALIGAVYLDSGWEAASKFVIHIFKQVIEEASTGNLTKDYKSLLQERFQQDGEIAIEYQVIKEEGPDHDKTFYVDLVIDNQVMGSGMGKSKKEAEQKAAKFVYESGD